MRCPQSITKRRITVSKAARYRWMVLSRCLAAVFGGYALASACTIFLALVLPLPRSDAVVLASLISYIVYLVAILWAFAAKTASQAWYVLVLPTTLLGGLSYLIHVNAV